MFGRMGRGFGRRSSGGAHRYSAQVIQFFDRLPAIPVLETQYETLINALVPDGTFALLDVLAVCCVDDQTSSLINLINGTYKPDITHVSGAPTWTQYVGWLTIGTNACLFSGHTLAGAAGNLSQNSNMIYAVTTSTAAGNTALWRTDVDSTFEIWPKYSGNALTKASNSTEDSTPNAADTSGRWMVNRTVPGSYRVLRNGSLFAPVTRASTAPETGDMKIGQGPFQVLGFAIGGGLSTSQEQTLDTAFYNFAHDPAVNAL